MNFAVSHGLFFGIVVRVGIITLIDEQVAREATDLLADWGSDLRVTASQIVRWRSMDLFQLPDGPRKGRGNTRQYRSNAPEVAAKFAIALSQVRDIDEAMLSVFVDGVDVGTEGIKASYDRVFRWAGVKLERARLNKRKPTMIGADGGGRSLSPDVRRSLLEVFTGREPSDPDWSERAVEQLAGREALDLFRADEGGLTRLTQVMGQLSFSTLRRTARNASVADLVWASDAANTLLQYSVTLSQLHDVTNPGTTPAALVTLANVGRVLRKVGVSTKLGVALLAPALLVMIATPERRANLDDAVNACKRELPRMDAILALAETLPQETRSCLGPGGATALALLPTDEREALSATIRKWIDQHPMAASLLEQSTPSEPNQKT
jgi:hypothetical protein